MMLVSKQQVLPKSPRSRKQTVASVNASSLDLVGASCRAKSVVLNVPTDAVGSAPTRSFSSSACTTTLLLATPEWATTPGQSFKKYLDGVLSKGDIALTTEVDQDLTRRKSNSGKHMKSLVLKDVHAKTRKRGGSTSPSLSKRLHKKKSRQQVEDEEREAMDEGVDTQATSYVSFPSLSEDLEIGA